MSLVETAVSQPSASSAPAIGRTASLGSDWRMCLIAVAITGMVTLAGEGFATFVVEIVYRLNLGINPAFIKFSSPLITAVYNLTLFWMLVTWLHGPERNAAVGLRWPSLRIWQWVAIVIALYAVKAVVSLAVIALTPVAASGGAAAAAAPTAGLAPFAAIMKTPAWPFLLLGGMLAAVFEELIYRGYLSRILEGSRLGFWGGALIASIIWAGLHFYYPLGMQVMLVAVGLLLSYIRAATGSVYPGMVWHVVNNTVALVAMRLLA